MGFFDVANGTLLFALVGVGIAYILFQSGLFLAMSLRRCRELGIDKKLIGDIVKSSIVFTIAPSLAIVLGLAALAPSLGIPWPWLRLSVIGSISYELMAANMASSALGFKSLADASLGGAEPLGAIMFAMSAGLSGAMILDIILIKKVNTVVITLKEKSGKFGSVALGVLFFAVIAVFVVPMLGAGGVTVLTFATSILVTMVQAVLIKRFGLLWLKNFVLTFSLILGMCSSVLWTALLG